MQTTTKVAASGGVALAACAACCAVPLASIIGGVAAFGGAVALWGTAAIAVAVPAVGIYMMSRRKQRGSPLAITPPKGTASACGCGTCGSEEKTQVIACSLDAGDFKTRTQGIRDLARRSLIRADRDGLTISLTYGIEALHEVTDLVAKERECCPFLKFEVQQRILDITLKITAPAEAAEAADLLFAHFAPDLAKETQTTEAA